MQLLDGRLVYAASDLNNYLECEHLVALSRSVAHGERERPPRDETTELIADKGLAHEAAYLERLRRTYPDLVEIERDEARGERVLHAAEARTVAAMRAGASFIYQGTFFDGTFVGYADFLRRVDLPSDLGPWSYEVLDTKLALHDKPYFIIQLCHYSEHLERVQGRLPERMHVVLGSNEERPFRVENFFAYYRHLKATFLARGAASDAYPLPVPHCSICDWHDACAGRRRDDDHLSLVAGMRRDQVARFEEADVATVAALGGDGASRPPGMAAKTFDRLRRQARMQLRERADGRSHYDFITHRVPEGFGLLPPSDRGDLFFDMEGDQFFEIGKGLEYLFGFYAPNEDRFTPFWGFDRDGERAAFEQAVDFIVERRKRYPAMHVYHYAPYEKVALRTLAQRHLTREAEVDELLRAEVLVDCYGVVRGALVISKESYSIKKLEAFYEMRRLADVRKGDDSIVQFELWLKDRDRGDILESIERYNEEDCRSTYLLREWLLAVRDEYAARGNDVAFRKIGGVECHADVTEGCKPCADRERTRREDAKISDVQRALVARSDSSARLLGHLLSYHRREEKPAWWALFDRAERPQDLVEFDKEAIGGLVYAEDVEPYRKGRERNFTYAFRFPEQEYSLKIGSTPYDPQTKKAAGEIVDLDENANMVWLKYGGDPRELHALIPGAPIVATAQKEALFRIGQAYLDGTLRLTSPNVLDILNRSFPRMRDRSPGDVIQPAEATPEAIYAAVRALDGSYLFVQGPPGTGKTWRAARVIARLLRDGRRVGVMANSHKAAHNLLHALEDVLANAYPGLAVRGVHKSSSSSDSRYDSKLPASSIEDEPQNAPIETGDFTIISGTGHLFARAGMAGKLDDLFIDEAGQVALAEAIAVAPAAENVILLGDPMQLAQVSQGGHGEHAGSSVLEHLLGEGATIAPNRGILLDVTYRMAPPIARFISDAVYENRLRNDSCTEENAISSGGTLAGSGLRFIPLEHANNSRESPEEAERIVMEIATLLRGGTFVREKNPPQPITERDVLVVSPYNAQRIRIAARLRDAGYPHVRVGTVDKFQGQEAPVVFYSMATSSADDVPRSLDFLFEKNRFNVAVSRAQCLAVLVASPRLLDVRCSTTEQLAMVNVVCKFVESTPA